MGEFSHWRWFLVVRYAGRTIEVPVVNDWKPEEHITDNWLFAYGYAFDLDEVIDYHLLDRGERIVRAEDAT